MQDRPQRAAPKGPEVIVEIAQPWRQPDQFDPGVIRAGVQRRQRLIPGPGRVVITQDVSSGLVL